MFSCCWQKNIVWFLQLPIFWHVLATYVLHSHCHCSTLSHMWSRQALLLFQSMDQQSIIKDSFTFSALRYARLVGYCATILICCWVLGPHHLVIDWFGRHLGSLRYCHHCMQQSQAMADCLNDLRRQVTPNRWDSPVMHQPWDSTTPSQVTPFFEGLMKCLTTKSCTHFLLTMYPWWSHLSRLLVESTP